MRVQLAPRIVVDSENSFGKPTIEGTRVPVAIVVGNLGGGMTVEEVMDEYLLTRDDVRASWTYAGRLVERQRLRHGTSRAGRGEREAEDVRRPSPE